MNTTPKPVSAAPRVAHWLLAALAAAVLVAAAAVSAG